MSDARTTEGDFDLDWEDRGKIWVLRSVRGLGEVSQASSRLEISIRTFIFHFIILFHPDATE